MSDTEAPPGVKVTIDGVEISAKPGELVIDAAERHGVYIPRFCYHHRMKPVGMCRMCLVEIDAGRGPALQPSCMIPVSPDMKVDTTSERTKKAQEGVLEFLLINHPLDCPVCDKGGECPLQDQTMAYGPGESRFVEEKRHYEKPIPISDLVYLDRERCILCDRCTRFAKDVAGDPLIHFQGRGSRTEVNTFPDEPFSSYFSGNTVQICPVGALTARPYRFKARPWDLDEVTSACQTCSVGCTMTIQSSRNQVLRYTGVDNDAVNWSWMCDKGRFNFEQVHSDGRLGEPLVDGNPARWTDALRAAGKAIADAVAAGGPGAVAVIGGARLTNESAYAWAKLAKGIIGTDHVDCQLGDGLDPQFLLGLPRATIAETCRPKGVIVLLGPDPKEELPVLSLRLRHAVVEDGATLIEVGHGPSGMTRHARHTFFALPGGDLVDAARAALEVIPADTPFTVIVGRTSLSESSAVIAEAASVFAERGARFLPALARGNVFGALDAGLSPGLLPGRVTLDQGRSALLSAWASVPSSPGLDTAGILQAAADGRVQTLVLLGADPVADFPDRALAEAALARATVVAVDTFLNDSSRLAQVVLPAAGYAEVPGTATNIEGRVQLLQQKVTPPGTARADWMIAVDLAARLGGDLGVESVEDLFAEFVGLAPSHAGLALHDVASSADGVLAADTVLTSSPVAAASRTPLDAAALRLVATSKMYDAATLTQQSACLAALAPETVARLHPLDFEKLGVAPGTTVRFANARAAVDLPVEPDAGVVRGSVSVVANLPDCQLNRLFAAANPVTDVRLEVPR